jgi:hypothetical protein
MKPLLTFLLLLALTGCSQKSSPESASQLKINPVPYHQYLVTFAAVRIPNEMLKPNAAHANGINLGAIKDRYEFARYVLAHTNEFSFTTTKGNFLPTVATGGQTSIKFLLDPSQEQADLERTGIQLQSLQADVKVKNEDDHGYVWYEGHIGYGVHLKEPVGGSVDHGGDIPFPGGLLPVGQPDIIALFETKDFTLCGLVALNRERR